MTQIYMDSLILIEGKLDQEYGHLSDCQWSLMVAWNKMQTIPLSCFLSGLLYNSPGLSQAPFIS